MTKHKSKIMWTNENTKSIDAVIRSKLGTIIV